MPSSSQQNRRKSGVGSCSPQTLASIATINEHFLGSRKSPAQVPVWRPTRSLSSPNDWYAARDGGRCKCGCSRADRSPSDEKGELLVLQATHNKSNKKQGENQGEKQGEKLDFSFLKQDLSADYDNKKEKEKGKESSNQACENDLEIVEKILQNMRGQVNQLVLSTKPRDAKTKCKVYKLKRHLNDISSMLTCMEQGRDTPCRMKMKGNLGKIECKCAHSGRNLYQKRDQLADLKNLYEQNLLMTPTDVNWPFVHVTLSNLPTVGKVDFMNCGSDYAEV